jgi:hypothetical protein
VQKSIPIDKIPLGIIVFNEFNKIISTNIIGKVFLEKTKDCMLEVINDIVSKTLHSNVPIEKIIKYSNMNDFFVWRIKTEPIKYTSPEIVVIIQDETITYQLQQTILKAEKLAVAGQLAIGSLVEIRNPLTIARGFCQFIEEHSEIEEEYIEIILNELKQIQDIIENCMSMVDTSQYSNLELLYKKIWACVGSQIDSYILIMVTDDFDNLTINIAEEHVNSIIIRLIKILDIWLEENTCIIISVELSEEARYLNLNIRAYCDIKWDAYGPENLETMIKCLEGNNKQMELQFINNNTIVIQLHLPIIIPQYFRPKLKSEMSKVLLSK